jgi:excisionase family DNA binding protein
MTVSYEQPRSAAEEKRLLTIEQAAERLSTSPRFVRRLVAERRIGFTKLGRHVRISVADVDAFVDAGRVEPRGVEQGEVLPPPRRPSRRSGKQR